MKSKSLVHTIFSVGAATILTKLVALIALGYPARTLGPENYGHYTYGISIAAYANIFLISGLTVWGTRHIAQNKENAGETIGSINFVRLLLALLSYLSIYVFATTQTSSLIEKYILLVCGLTLFTNALSVDWALNGLEKTALPPWLNLINTSIVVTCLFIFIHAPEDVIAYAFISPISTLLLISVSYYFIYSYGIKVSFPSPKLVFEAIGRSKLLIAVFSLITIGHYAGNIIIKANMGPGSLGVFMAAYYLFELTSSIPSLIGTIVFPKISGYVAIDKIRAPILAKTLSQGYMVLGFFIVSILYAEASFIIDIVYGQQYAESVDLFKIMCVGLIFNFAVCGYTNILMAFSEDKTILLVTLTSNILAVTLGIIFIPIYGLFGAAAIVAIIDGAGWLVSLRKYKYVIGNIDLKKWIRPATGALMVVGISTLDAISGIHVVYRFILYGIVQVIVSLKDISNVFRELKYSK